MHALPSRWLYADLDAIDPRALPAHFTPSLAWETSPHRFQALWLLDRHITIPAFERLNQRLTYATGADKGGWSATKVLRVPGSLSTKYQETFRVRLIKLDKPRKHRVETLTHLLRDTQITSSDANLGALPPSDVLPDPIQVLAEHKRSLPSRTRQLLRAKTLLNSDDRSARLWELYTSLLAAGLEPAEVFVLVRSTVWNKYKGQRREGAQLWIEIGKAAAKAQTAAAASTSNGTTNTQDNTTSNKKTPKNKKFKRELVNVTDFRARRFPQPNWLVEEIWTRGAFGFLAGESKTYKSLLGMDLAISIATGTSFLNTFRIPAQAPVLLWQEENDEGLVQERIRRIELARGLHYRSNGYNLDLHGTTYPLFLGNRHAIDLNNPIDLKYLVRGIHKHNPKLVILDPLYMMIPTLDERESAAMMPTMRNLAKIQTQLKVSIMVVHHYHKPQQGTKGGRPMHRLSGTGIFGRRYDSAIWVEAQSSPAHTVRIASSHRSKIDGKEFKVTFDMPDDDEVTYKPHVSEWAEDDELDNDAGDQIIDLAKTQTTHKTQKTPNTFAHITEPVKLRDLAKELSVKSGQLKIDMEREGFTFEKGKQYTSKGVVYHVQWAVPPNDTHNP